jgi:hypothetical protein
MLSAIMSPAEAVPSDAEKKLVAIIVVVLPSVHKRGESSSNAVHNPMIKPRGDEMLDGQLWRFWNFLAEFLVQAR